MTAIGAAGERRVKMRARRGCLGPGCSSTRLCKAHIVPQAFARHMRSEPTEANLLVTAERVGKAVGLGYYDPDILCSLCDANLGVLDKVAVEFVRSFPTRASLDDLTYEHLDADPGLLRRFAAALIWRASVSKLPPFKEVQLGPHEQRIRDLAFGVTDVSAVPEFELVVMRYVDTHLRENIDRFYTMPKRLRFEGLSGYAISLGGFRWLMKVDARPLRPEILSSFSVTHQAPLRGLVVPFSKTPEFEGIAEMMVAELRRHPRRN